MLLTMPKEVLFKTKEEIEIIRQNCLLVCKTLAKVGELLKPGITGTEIDRAAEELIRDYGAVPGFKGYRGFPATLCISPNEGVVHGIPNEKEFLEGDIISVDCGVYKDQFYGDAAYTFAVGQIKPKTLALLRATNESLYKGIKKAVVGNRVGDIGFAIQQYIERKHQYSIVRELVGHGIGRNLHEKPDVPNFGRKNSGLRLKEGLVIAIEPMVNLGKKNVVQAEDGWTIRSKDHSPSAHYEHTVAVRKGNADILSDHSFIEIAVKKNPNLTEISINN